MPENDEDDVNARWHRFVDSGYVIVKPAGGETAAAPMPEHLYWYARHGKLKAPHGKFKVILADTFDHTDATLGVYDAREEAVRIAREHSGSMKVCFVYDDRARVVGEFGEP